MITAVFIRLPRNTNQDEEGTPTQLGGRPESACKEDGGMRATSEPAEGLAPPHCNAEPAGRPEVDEEEEDDEEEEGCRSRQNSPERAGQSYSDTVTDALIPKQHSSSQEGEPTYCPYCKTPETYRNKTAHKFPPNSPTACLALPWICISFPHACFESCVRTLPWDLR